MFTSIAKSSSAKRKKEKKEIYESNDNGNVLL